MQLAVSKAQPSQLDRLFLNAPLETLLLQLREIGGRVMAEAPLLPPHLAPRLQLRSQLLPTLHIARTQHQAFLRPEPRRQARDHPRRAHHDQTRRGPPPTAGPTLVVAMAAEGCAPGRCSSSAGPPRRSTETSPASSSGSPSGTASTPPSPRARPSSPGASAPAVAPAVAAPSSSATPPRS